MLQSFRVKGFKSFQNDTEFDFRRTQYQTLESTNVESGILKGALFVGGNASGKTNAVEAIRFLLMVLFSSRKMDWNQRLCLFSESGVMELEYRFVIEGRSIRYQIRYQKEDTLLSEWLWLDETLMLERTGSYAKSELSDRKEFHNIPEKTLFLRDIWFNTQFRNHQTLQNWFSFLENSIYLNPLTAQMIYFGAESEMAGTVELDAYLKKNGAEEMNAFLRECGFSYSLRYDPDKGSSRSNFPGLSLIRDGISAEIPMDEESMGTQFLVSTLPPYLYVLKHGGMLLFDEFSSGLHNDLEELLVRYFMKRAHGSQIILVSHSTNLLSSRLLRPDQIYAVNFDREGSNVVRFSSRQPRVGQNFEKMYLSGIFSGLPHYHDV